MTANGAASQVDWVDPDDAPEWTEEMFEQADLYEGDRLIEAGKPPSKVVTGHELILSPESIVKRFRETGPGWQARVDEALAKWLTEQSKASSF